MTNLFYDVSAYAGREVKLELIGPFGPGGTPQTAGAARRGDLEAIKLLGPINFPTPGGMAYLDSLAFIPAQPKIRFIGSGTGLGTNYTEIYFHQRHEKKVHVEYRDSLNKGSWRLLPGGPYSIGPVMDVHAGSQRFYRLRDADP